jgi:hypothetical protein
VAGAPGPYSEYSEHAGGVQFVSLAAYIAYAGSDEPALQVPDFLPQE